MYRCGNCGGTFLTFKTPGQCPICGKWARVKCGGCGHTDIAEAFIKNGNRCPHCGTRVRIDGTHQTGNTYMETVYGCSQCGTVFFLVCPNCGKRRWFLIILLLLVGLIFTGLIGNFFFSDMSGQSFLDMLEFVFLFLLLGPGIIFLALRSIFSKKPVSTVMDINSSFSSLQSTNSTAPRAGEHQHEWAGTRASNQAETLSASAGSTPKLNATSVTDVDQLIERLSNPETRSGAARQLGGMSLDVITKAVQLDWVNAVYMLIELYDATPKGEGFQTATVGADHVANIGRALNQLGGMDQMLEAHGLFAQFRPRAARNLEILWGGIGNWLG